MATQPSGYGAGGYGLGGYGGGGQEVFTEPIEYYLSLITSQYQNSPKFLAWLRAALQVLDDVTACLYSMDWNFDLNNAVGAQLDMLGQIVGASRTLPFQPSGGVSPILDDAHYRTLLIATIGANQWNGTIDQLQPLWAQLFPGGRILVQDNQDMTMNVSLSGAFDTLYTDMVNHGLIVPRPEGVLINYGFANLPILGFDENNSYIAGFDLGKWS